MSFPIVLQRNNSKVNQVDKNLTDIVTLNGFLRSDTSIIDPVIVIDAVIDVSDIASCNYMYIESFGRWYYVRNIIQTTANLWHIHAHCDVLMSFKSQIRECRAIVKRQENEWNLYLDDGFFRSYQNPIIQTKVFPAGFNTEEFVFAIAGTN